MVSIFLVRGPRLYFRRGFFGYDSMETIEQWGFLEQRIETFDPENLLEVVRDGRFDHRLLEGGSFEVRLRRAVFGNSSLDCGDYSPAFAVNGQFSPTQICLGFIPRAEKPTWCNGFNVAKGEILCFSEGAELQFRNAPHTTWQALLIDRSELQEVATILTGQSLKLPEHGTVNFKSQDQASSLSSVIDIALSDLAGSGSLSGPAATSLSEEIVNAFVRATTSTGDSSRGNQRNFAGYRFTAMRRAEEFLRENMESAFSSRGLCAATRMSERSIELLFKEAYGISPRAWSQIARLNAARQDLLKRNLEEVRVSDVAVRWGFFHFGRFSAAYRYLFGELPSVTAAKKSRCVCGWKLGATTQNPPVRKESFTFPARPAYE
jgi:AraC family ethanolamine operon transcriptional activator